MVVRRGVTTEDQVNDALEQVQGVTMIGIILNAFSTKVPQFILRRIPTP